MSCKSGDPAKGQDGKVSTVIEEDDRRDPNCLEPTSPGSRAQLARRLKQIEAIGSDSKLTALVSLLGGLSARPTAKICVLTDYLSTLYYVAAEIEALGLPLHLLQAEIESSARERHLAEFASKGGILVASVVAITEAFDLPGDYRSGSI